METEKWKRWKILKDDNGNDDERVSIIDEPNDVDSGWGVRWEPSMAAVVTEDEEDWIGATRTWEKERERDVAR